MSRDSDTNQLGILNKKIPEHRRPKFQVETKEEVFQKVDSRRDQSKRLFFRPFQLGRKISNKEEVGHFRRTIKTSSKFAESFKFDLSIHENLNSKVFSQLSQEVKKTHGLRAFDIFMWEAGIPDLALKNLGIGLKPLKHLKYLKVKLLVCGNINNQGIIYFARAIRSVVSLETLDLTFDEGGQIDDEAVRVLWRSLRYLKALKTLNVSFYYCQAVAYKEIGIIEKTFKGLKSLKEINLDFSISEDMDLEGIANLSETFKMLTGLEKIGLRLWGVDNLENEGLKKLMEGIEGKASLKSIKLEIGNTYVTDEGLDYLKDYLKGLSGIEDIWISFVKRIEVTKEAVEVLKKSLEEIPSLKRLKVISEIEEEED